MPARVAEGGHHLSKTACLEISKALLKGQTRDFPGGSAAKAPRSQCRGPGFDPWSGN